MVGKVRKGQVPDRESGDAENPLDGVPWFAKLGFLIVWGLIWLVFIAIPAALVVGVGLFAWKAVRPLGPASASAARVRRSP